MSTDISVVELKKRLDAGETINLIDVREQHEYDEFNFCLLYTSDAADDAVCRSRWSPYH